MSLASQTAPSDRLNERLIAPRFTPSAEHLTSSEFVVVDAPHNYSGSSAWESEVICLPPVLLRFPKLRLILLTVDATDEQRLETPDALRVCSAVRTESYETVTVKLVRNIAIAHATFAESQARLDRIAECESRVSDLGCGTNRTKATW